MTTRTQQTTPGRWALPFLAALVAILATVFGAASASAAATPGAETRVRASQSLAQDIARPPEDIRAGQRLGNDGQRVVTVVATGVAAETGAPLIKAGSQGGATAGKPFSQGMRQRVLDENPSTCVYCRMETDRPQVDHVIPRSRGGNATFENGQTTCGWCNASKGARDFPVNPPPGFEGMWPPSWWGFLF